MASIGKISIGSRSQSGCAYVLTRRPKRSHTIKIDGWEIECRSDSLYLAVRYQGTLAFEELVYQGNIYAQQGLDLLSVCFGENLHLTDTENDCIFVFTEHETAILKAVKSTNIEFYMSSEVKVVNPTGTTPSRSISTIPTWYPMLRYYRLGETAGDIFDGYRNLYLSFEGLLDFIEKKQGTEAIDVWMRRALTEAGKHVNLELHARKDCKDPIAYIIQKQYKSTRCNLFHAQNIDLAIEHLPHEKYDRSKIRNSYAELAYLWKDLARAFLNISISGGGVTFSGFHLITDRMFSSVTEVFATTDNTPPSDDETEISPAHHPVHSLGSVHYVGAVGTGISEYRVSVEACNFPEDFVIHRLVTVSDGKPILVEHYEDGIILHNVDKFQFVERLYLINESDNRR